MALVKCGECKGQISTNAKACPHCGSRLSPITSSMNRLGWDMMKLAVLLVLGFFALIVFGKR
jgi:predicted amidophosphoribosyltransferase